MRDIASSLDATTTEYLQGISANPKLIAERLRKRADEHPELVYRQEA
jgi:hypothetical protein